MGVATSSGKVGIGIDHSIPRVHLGIEGRESLNKGAEKERKRSDDTDLEVEVGCVDDRGLTVASDETDFDYGDDEDGIDGRRNRCRRRKCRSSAGSLAQSVRYLWGLDALHGEGRGLEEEEDVE